ncbi:cell division protein 48-like protein [Glossina pallidipes salivary gland hypertrophy virus]|uniref:Cell division protein 48-like protein n=1 Tax=Glossina hytrovirus (isolate Glossina pallidipes/Ethiopia/Seibersdorf/-) TaxID=379529 RepID=B0YLR2_GHVS|nr:cell division protein 48-like protein [Glossina pallidipes salivary gland hypertrophy virus]ABQ08881.1 cell division protein 48-like protein [Glossina pallidipes salivary gland hypertrophy virus]
MESLFTYSLFWKQIYEVLDTFHFSSKQYDKNISYEEKIKQILNINNFLWKWPDDMNNERFVENKMLIEQIDVKYKEIDMAFNNLKTLQSFGNSVNEKINNINTNLHVIYVNLIIIIMAYRQEFGHNVKISPTEYEWMKKYLNYCVLYASTIHIFKNIIAAVKITEADINEILNTGKLIPYNNLFTLTSDEKAEEIILQDMKKNLFLSSTKTYNDLAGLDIVIQDISQIIDLAFINEYSKFILLAGPPGSGKTSLAEAMASQFSLGYYYRLDTEFFIPLQIGYVEERIKILFKHLRTATKPTTVIIDEVDRIIGVFNSTFLENEFGTIKTTLQTELSGINGPLSNKVIVIGMTNYLNNIDPVMLRRITNNFFIDLPSNEDAVSYLMLNLFRKTIKLDEGDQYNIYFPQNEDYFMQIYEYLVEKFKNVRLSMHTMNQLYENLYAQLLTFETVKCSYVKGKDSKYYLFILPNDRIIQIEFNGTMLKIEDADTKKLMKWYFKTTNKTMMILPDNESLNKASSNISFINFDTWKKYKDINTFQYGNNSGE